MRIKRPENYYIAAKTAVKLLSLRNRSIGSARNSATVFTAKPTTYCGTTVGHSAAAVEASRLPRIKYCVVYSGCTNDCRRSTIRIRNFSSTTMAHDCGKILRIFDYENYETKSNIAKWYATNTKTKLTNGACLAHYWRFVIAYRAPMHWHTRTSRRHGDPVITAAAAAIIIIYSNK